jgi:hypothetical protein
MQAEAAAKDGLSAIPADAIGFIYIPNVKRVDGDYREAIKNLELGSMIPPTMTSLVGLMKAKLPMLEGMDEDGSFAVVVMPAQTPYELWAKLAILIPTKKPKAMIETMGGQAREDGLWTANMMGQPGYAAIGQNRVIFAKTPDVANAVKESKAGIASKLKPGEKKALDGLDLAVWINGDRLLTLVKPMVDGFLVPMMTMQASAGAFQAKSAEANKQQIDMFMKGTASLLLGVSLEGGGLDLRFAMTSKPGSELAEQTRVKNTAGSLLGGLGAPKYLLAFGETANPTQIRASLKNLDAWFSVGEESEEIDAEKLKRLQGIIEEAAPMLTGLRGAIEALPPGPAGLFGLSVVIDTTDSNKALELTGKCIQLAREILADAAKKAQDEELEELHDAITYEEESEEIAGAKVGHLKVDLSKIEELDEDDLEEILKVIGREGVLIRMAPVDAKRIAVGFGGGKQRMGAIIEAARKNEAPLDRDAGVRKVSAYLPKKRAAVAYLAVDRIVASLHNVTKALDEEDPTVHMPAIDAPLAMAAAGSDGMIRYDVFFPTELLVAVKNASMVLLAPPGAPPSPGKTPPPGKPAPTPDHN